MEKRKWMKPVFRIVQIDEDVVTLSGETTESLEQGDCFGKMNF